jgi:hypothetical protein
MTKEKLNRLEELVSERLKARRSLGSASYADGEILIIWQVLSDLIQHLNNRKK